MLLIFHFTLYGTKIFILWSALDFLINARNIVSNDSKTYHNYASDENSYNYRRCHTIKSPADYFINKCPASQDAQYITLLRCLFLQESEFVSCERGA